MRHTNCLPHPICHGATVAPDQVGHSARFKNVFCSQCGQDFGPGDSGYSHCRHHEGRTPVVESMALRDLDAEHIAAAQTTVIAVDLADLKACEQEDAGWAKQWDQTAVEQAIAALPSRLNDKQAMQILRAVLAAHDNENGDFTATLDDGIATLQNVLVAQGIDEAELAMEQRHGLLVAA